MLSSMWRSHRPGAGGPTPPQDPRLRCSHHFEERSRPGREHQSDKKLVKSEIIMIRYGIGESWMSDRPFFYSILSIFNKIPEMIFPKESTQLSLAVCLTLVAQDGPLLRRAVSRCPPHCAEFSAMDLWGRWRWWPRHPRTGRCSCDDAGILVESDDSKPRSTGWKTCTKFPENVCQRDNHIWTVY